MSITTSSEGVGYSCDGVGNVVGEGMARADGSVMGVDGGVASRADDESVESLGAIVHDVQRTSIHVKTRDFKYEPPRCMNARPAHGLETCKPAWPILPFLPFAPGGG